MILRTLALCAVATPVWADFHTTAFDVFPNEWGYGGRMAFCAGTFAALDAGGDAELQTQLSGAVEHFSEWAAQIHGTSLIETLVPRYTAIWEARDDVRQGSIDLGIVLQWCTQRLPEDLGGGEYELRLR